MIENEWISFFVNRHRQFLTFHSKTYHRTLINTDQLGNRPPLIFLLYYICCVPQYDIVAISYHLSKKITRKKRSKHRHHEWGNSPHRHLQIKIYHFTKQSKNCFSHDHLPPGAGFWRWFWLPVDTTCIFFWKNKKNYNTK